MTSANIKNEKNVLFILVDALYAKQLGINGRCPSPTSTLDHLFRDALCFTNYYAVGCPTQFALPGIFSSTLPLDNGGYEYGIRDRETSLAQVFQQRGHQTCAFVSSFGLGRLFSYDKGFDEYYSLFDVSLYLANLERVYLAYYRQLIADHEITAAQAAKAFAPFLGEFLKSLRSYSAEKLAEIEIKNLMLSPYIHRWDFAELVDVLAEEEGRYRHDPEAYTVKLISDEIPLVRRILRIVRPLSVGRKSAKKVRLAAWDTLAAFRGKKTKYGVHPTIQKNIHLAMSMLLKKRQFHLLPMIGLLAIQQTRVASAGFVIQNFIRWIDSNDKTPFFSFIHLMDAHDSSFQTYDTQLHKEAAIEELDELMQFYGELTNSMEHGSFFGGFLGDVSTRYDLSIRYIDYRLSILLKYLATNGLLKDTVIVVTSDHGSEAGGAAGRGVRSVRADYDSFCDELYHCPLAIYADGAEPRQLDMLCSSLDLTPTLLDYMGMDIPTAFRGKSLLRYRKQTERDDVVIMEHLGRGPCDPAHKKVRICVMNNKYKIVYEQSLLSEESGVLAQAYVLPAGSGEDEHRLAKGMLPEGAEDLLTRAQNRAKQIRREFQSGRPDTVMLTDTASYSSK